VTDRDRSSQLAAPLAHDRDFGAIDLHAHEHPRRLGGGERRQERGEARERHGARYEGGRIETEVGEIREALSDARLGGRADEEAELARIGALDRLVLEERVVGLERDERLDLERQELVDLLCRRRRQLDAPERDLVAGHRRDHLGASAGEA
jgi:hypothetical protein